MNTPENSSIRSAAQMLSVKHRLHLSYLAGMQVLRRNRERRQAILSGSRACACGRPISGNKACCRACLEAKS